jgi:arginase
MAVRVIEVPYDAARRDERMGRGPHAFVRHGLMKQLSGVADSVVCHTVEHRSDFPVEAETTFALQRGVAEQVRVAGERDELPLVLSGMCNSTVGALAGSAAKAPALVWFDSHGDFNTPETSESGFLDGMALSIVVGHCWRRLARSVPGFRPVEERRIALVGARDIDTTEQERLDASKIVCLGWERIRNEGAAAVLGPVIENWRSECDGVYLHVDMDVHDPSLAPVNAYQAPGGLTPQEVRDCARAAAEGLPLVGASVTAYDPETDPEQKGLDTGVELLTLLARLKR